MNQATTVYETGYGGVQRPGPARDAMLAAMEEVRAVAAAQGVSLTRQDVDGWMDLLATFDPAGMPSMRQDALARRPTEVALFAGTITRLGRETGVPTPVNDRFLQAIRAMEAGWKK
ncbi:ketopantoate reductase family protein [Allofournierella sp.]|uniref:ketopantoate reductase family protein n=1 Tax=Allofournierella sp. TaxID=1940256 RepID=UPI003AB4AEF7